MRQSKSASGQQSKARQSKGKHQTRKQTQRAKRTQLATSQNGKLGFFVRVLRALLAASAAANFAPEFGTTRMQLQQVLHKTSQQSKQRRRQRSELSLLAAKFGVVCSAVAASKERRIYSDGTPKSRLQPEARKRGKAFARRRDDKRAQLLLKSTKSKLDLVYSCAALLLLQKCLFRFCLSLSSSFVFVLLVCRLIVAGRQLRFAEAALRRRAVYQSALSCVWRANSRQRQ